MTFPSKAGSSLLFLSNGHGEDLNASLIIQALSDHSSDVRLGAMPLVGSGDAYRKLSVPIIGPTQVLPSGGLIYTQLWNWFKDLGAGLIGLTLQQFRAVQRYSNHCDGLVAVGDIFPIVMAYLTGRPFVAFLVSTSSYYEGRLRLPGLTTFCLRSQRCRSVLTRDAFTAQDLQKRGMTKAYFLGYPIMDTLTPKGLDLGLNPEIPMIALLPGSRLPEALHNLALQLRVCTAITECAFGSANLPSDSFPSLQFRVALVADFREIDLEQLATEEGWHYQSFGILKKTVAEKTIEVRCLKGSFANILHHCQLAIGMAGTAVEQAVGLGKPVVQIPGGGPQFTYPFAEAQMRLLGYSVQTVGKKPTEPDLFRKAAELILKILGDRDYIERCQANGRERVGLAGGSIAIADHLLKQLNK